MSQEALGTDAGLQTAHVSRIVRGIANPTLDVLVRVARALRADIGTLFLDVVVGSPVVPNLKRGRKRKR